MVADSRPTIPNRLGPILFLPGSAVWHSRHFLNTTCPAATSPWAQAGVAAAMARQVKMVRAILMLPPNGANDPLPGGWGKPRDPVAMNRGYLNPVMAPGVSGRNGKRPEN